jgi:hypothetical protein
LAALPILYYDDELNTHYADLIKNLTPIDIVKTLDEKYNLRELIKEKMAEGGEDTSFITILANIINTVNRYLEPYELDAGDLFNMAEDSGLSMQDIMEIYTYLTTEPEPASSNQRAATATDKPLMTPFLTDYYVNYLTKWYTNKSK